MATIVVALVVSTAAMAQESDTERTIEEQIAQLQSELTQIKQQLAETQKTEKPAEKAKKSQFEGKIKTVVFTNFSQGLFSNNELTKFTIERAVFGYDAKFGHGLSAKLEVDFAAVENDDYSPEDEYATYVRNAELIWQKGDFTTSFGMTTPTIFNFVEKFWGYRYIVKSAMDEYKFGNSRDLGATLTYKPADWVSLDATVLNGEGYKYFNLDNNLKYSLGATLEPVSGLWMRVYGEIYDNTAVDGGKDQCIAAGFLGYKGKNYSIGAEYNYLWNKKFVEARDQSLISVYGSYKFSDKYSIFARYDNMKSRDDWNGFEEAYYLGFDYRPVKYVNIGPTFSCKNNVDDRYAPVIGLFLGLVY